HERARLVPLRVEEPRSHAREVIWKDSCTDRPARRDVRDVWTCGSDRDGAADRVAIHADVGEENAFPVAALRRGRQGLRGEPGVELALRLDDDADAHPGVFDAAELGALPIVGTGAAREEPEMIGRAGQHVGFRTELGYPEAVDHVD